MWMCSCAQASRTASPAAGSRWRAASSAFGHQHGHARVVRQAARPSAWRCRGRASSRPGPPRSAGRRAPAPSTARSSSFSGRTTAWRALAAVRAAAPRRAHRQARRRGAARRRSPLADTTSPGIRFDTPMKPATKVGARALVDLLGVVELLDHAAVHDRDAVGHRERLLLVVRHVDERDADVALDALQLDLQLLAQLQVERAERLVEQQHGGAVDERARERDALLLAARELARLALGLARRGRRARAPRATRRRDLVLRDAAGAGARRRRCRSTLRCGNSA